jgi:hypothetical protein
VSGYEPRFDLNRLSGEEAERYVSHLRSALGAGAIEVKRDDQAHKTGNVYVEYACRSKIDGEYHPSGIATTKATTWAIYMDGAVVFLPVWVLRIVAKKDGLKRSCVYGGNPTHGLAVPLAKLLVAAVAVMHAPIDDERRAA